MHVYYELGSFLGCCIYGIGGGGGQKIGYQKKETI